MQMLHMMCHVGGQVSSCKPHERPAGGLLQVSDCLISLLLANAIQPASNRQLCCPWDILKYMDYLKLGSSSCCRCSRRGCLGAGCGRVGVAVHLLKEACEGRLLLVLLRERICCIARILLLLLGATCHGCAIPAVHSRVVKGCRHLLLGCQLL